VKVKSTCPADPETMAKDAGTIEGDELLVNHERNGVELERLDTSDPSLKVALIVISFPTKAFKGGAESALLFTVIG